MGRLVERLRLQNEEMSKIVIPDKVKFQKDYKVRQSDTAAALGSGAAEVFSTPAMIALMENTAMKCLEPYLPDGFTSVGIHLDVSHLKAVKPGNSVTSYAEVVKVDGLKITFKVEVKIKEETVGKGSHTRFIVNMEDFMKRL